ncbi:hypothetical protein KIPB_009455, partial [Kipferlia bialata]|eukprot:g9455.t1
MEKEQIRGYSCTLEDAPRHRSLYLSNTGAFHTIMKVSALCNPIAGCAINPQSVEVE